MKSYSRALMQQQSIRELENTIRKKRLEAAKLFIEGKDIEAFSRANNAYHHLCTKRLNLLDPAEQSVTSFRRKNQHENSENNRPKCSETVDKAG